MEQDVPEQKSSPSPQSPPKKPAVTHARPKLSEDRLKDADGKPPVKRDYGSKAQWVIVGVLGVLCLAVYVMSHLHRKPAKPKAAEPAAVQKPLQGAPSGGVLIPGAGPPPSMP